MNTNLDEVINDPGLKKIIYFIAKKFYNVENIDLYQAGYIGAIKALKNYNINSGVEFNTFAYKYIFGEMYDLAKNNRNIKLNKNYLKIYKRIENAKVLLTQKFNKTPSLDEISRFLELDISLVNDVVITCSNIISLDDNIELNSETNLYNFIGHKEDYDTKILIKDSLEKLSEEERKVIDYRYFKDYTQEEVARILGINQVKVSRLETKSKKKIKEYICA
ncbi:MAG: sigma-70 family RNA polymerase sigma factor [Bacilli bacterium]|nr:sigma-70 family RNA polymerase sigma factor [Bacilli bacterium]